MTKEQQSARRIRPDDPGILQILHLIRESFAFMEGRIDPPSSMHALTVKSIRQQAATGEVWAIGSPPDAVVFLTPKPDRLYLGKLAVRDTQRGKGLARSLVTLAEQRAKALGFSVLELEARVELTENHRAFARFGFVVTGETAHPGYDRPTSLTMTKTLG